MEYSMVEEKSMVLIIDDDPAVRKLAHKAIEGLGEQSVAVALAREGLKYLENHQPDLILLDIMMPEIDGIEMLQQIKEREELRNIPVIMFSALSEEAAVRDALKAGAADYIVKPFRLRRVQEKIRMTLDQAQLPAGVNGNHNSGVTDRSRAKLEGIVLFVTTNPMRRNRLTAALSDTRLRTVSAHGALEALRFINTCAPDVVLIDDNLPVFRPVELKAKIYESPDRRSIPVVIAEKGQDLDDAGSSGILEELFTTIQQKQQSEDADPDSETVSANSDAEGYRILWWSESEELIRKVETELDGTYHVNFVESEDELLGSIVKWQPDAVLLDYKGQKETVIEILAFCQDRLNGVKTKYYLFSNDSHSEFTVEKMKSAGFQGVISQSSPQQKLSGVLNETFGINLIEVHVEEDLVILRRKPGSNVLAGREAVREIVEHIREGKARFILDYRGIDSIGLEEVEQLGEMIKYQRQYGIHLCVVNNSDRVREAFRNFRETRLVRFSPDLDSAREYLLVALEKEAAATEEPDGQQVSGDNGSAGEESGEDIPETNGQEEKVLEGEAAEEEEIPDTGEGRDG